MILAMQLPELVRIPTTLFIATMEMPVLWAMFVVMELALLVYLSIVRTTMCVPTIAVILSLVLVPT